MDMLGQSTSQQAMNTLILSNGLDSVITSPTRITEHSATLLDLLVTNIIRNTAFTGVLSDDISDHLPIFLFIKKFSSRVCRKQTVTVQDISESSLESFRNELLNSNLDEIISIKSVEQAYNTFLEKNYKHLQTPFPRKRNSFE